MLNYSSRSYQVSPSKRANGRSSIPAAEWQSPNRRRSLSRDCMTAGPHVSQPRRAKCRLRYFVLNEAGNNRRSGVSFSACRGFSSISGIRRQTGGKTPKRHNPSRLSGDKPRDGIASSANCMHSHAFSISRLHLTVKNAFPPDLQ